MGEPADVYGKYSLGSGAILSDPDRVWNDLADPAVIADYETSMRRDLAKSGLPIAKLADAAVMDIGTGRQALVFLKMGARSVDHFDISPENVARVQAHIGAERLQDRLRTTCADVVETELGEERYDLVYLNGIVQHFSDVGRGLGRCMRAVRKGGLLWLYFYRSGTFDNFVLYALRTLANGSNVVTDFTLAKEYYVAARLFFSPEARDNYLTSIFMDGVFTRYARLYSAATYLDVARRCGFDVVSSSGLDPLGRDVDHEFARAATVVTLRKVREAGEAERSEALTLLSPESEVDQLRRDLYDDPLILASLDRLEQLRDALSSRSVPASIRPLVVMRLFAVLAQTRAPNYDASRRHHDLQACLEAATRSITEEFGRT